MSKSSDNAETETLPQNSQNLLLTVKSASSKTFRRTFLAAVMLFALSVALFSQATGYEFLNYDDNGYVEQNPSVQQGLTWNGVAYALKTHDMATWAPLMWVSYMADTTLFGRQSSSYRMTNILLHATAGALLFLALHSLSIPFWTSVLLAGVFLVHPLRIESVVWISERKDVLFGFFWFLGLLAYARYVRKTSVLNYVLVFLCFICGIMSKFMMATFPFVLLLLDFWPLRRMGDRCGDLPVRAWPLVREKIPFLLVISICMYFTLGALKAEHSLHEIPLNGGHPVMRIFENYFFYMGKIFWPSSLSILYPVGDVQQWRATAGILVLAGITILSAWQMWKQPWLLVGWLWFVGTLAPVIGVVTFSHFYVANRYTYIPSVGLTIMVVIGVGTMMKRFGASQRFRFTMGASLILACVVGIQADLPRWKNSVNLFQEALRIGPHPVSYLSLSIAYYNNREYNHAIRYASQAIEMQPDYSQAYNSRGLCYEGKGMFEEAIRDYTKAIECRTENAKAWNNRGLSLASKGDHNSALRDFDKAIQLEPHFPEALINRASLWTIKKEYQKGIRDCTRAIDLNPMMVQAYITRGNVYYRMGDCARALADYDMTLNLRPEYADGYNNRASAFLGLKRYVEAAKDVERCRLLGGTPNEEMVKVLGQFFSENPTLLYK